MIEVKGLSKSYGRFKAVDGLDLKVEAGQVYGFLGPNGAGKTTTIKMLTGLLLPDEGEVFIDGKSMLSQPGEAKAAAAYVPDRPELFPYLTGAETMALTARLYGMDARESEARSRELLQGLGLLEWQGEAVSTYSHGMRQKLSFAAALLHRPKVFILDEPMVGLDPKGGRLIKDLMRRLADKGHTVFMSIHTLEIAEKMCDRLGILFNGKLLAEGSAEEIRGKAGKASGTDLEEVFLKLTGEDDSAESLEGLL